MQAHIFFSPLHVYLFICICIMYICSRDQVFLSIRKTADNIRYAFCCCSHRGYNGKERTHIHTGLPRAASAKHALASKFSYIGLHVLHCRPRHDVQVYYIPIGKQIYKCSGELYKVYDEPAILATVTTRRCTKRWIRKRRRKTRSRMTYNMYTI